MVQFWRQEKTPQQSGVNMPSPDLFQVDENCNIHVLDDVDRLVYKSILDSDWTEVPSDGVLYWGHTLYGDGLYEFAYQVADGQEMGASYKIKLNCPHSIYMPRGNTGSYLHYDTLEELVASLSEGELSFAAFITEDYEVTTDVVLLKNLFLALGDDTTLTVRRGASLTVQNPQYGGIELNTTCNLLVESGATLHTAGLASFPVKDTGCPTLCGVDNHSTLVVDPAGAVEFYTPNAESEPVTLTAGTYGWDTTQNMWIAK